MTYEELLEENAQLRDAVRHLRRLQKYEGHAKAESDKLGHEATTRFLYEEIRRLTTELAAANTRAGEHPLPPQGDKE